MKKLRLPFVRDEARRRRRARGDAPKTIIPMPDKPPLDPVRIEAARERLRREIPPRPAED